MNSPPPPAPPPFSCMVAYSSCSSLKPENFPERRAHNVCPRLDGFSRKLRVYGLGRGGLALKCRRDCMAGNLLYRLTLVNSQNNILFQPLKWSFRLNEQCCLVGISVMELGMEGGGIRAKCIAEKRKRANKKKMKKCTFFSCASSCVFHISTFVIMIFN